MRLWPERVFLIGAGGIILALCSPPPLSAQATAAVPFVGCPSSGQTETLEAPEGTSKSITISPKDAQALAYYESADGISVLAPRGWYCGGTSGSGGAALFLSPKPTHNTTEGWDGLEGAAIEVNHISSENSGRYEIAEVMGRVFPMYRTIAARFMEGIDLPLPSGAYPKDTLTYKSKTVVEYITPARTEGLGNFHSWIGKNDLPVRGAAILIGHSTSPLSPGDLGELPSLILLSVRLPPDLARLTSTIIRYIERENR